MKELMKNVGALIFIFVWGVGGTILWWNTNNPEWLYGWVITLIIGMAG